MIGSNAADNCPTCLGRGWTRGFVGGVYDCGDCWKYNEVTAVKDESLNKFCAKFNESTITELPKKRGRPKLIKD
jgi:hypothetical protein